MKLKLKYFDPSDVTTFVNKGTGKHVISDGFTTIPIYKGKLYSIKDVVNSDGTVNVRKAKKIMEEVAEYFGGKKMQHRPENPVWHKDDPNTWLHTKKVALNAWQIPVPEGYTKQDQMIAALGHDFGKIISGDGHAEVSYNLLKLIFPDATEKQLNAIRKHMDDLGTHTDMLETATKFADLGVTPSAALETLGLTPEELEIVKQTKWFKKGGTIQNEIILYHNCPKSALNSILKNGIKASYSVNKNNLTHKEISDKVNKIPKVVYLGNKRMADGIGAYRKKHGYANDGGITLELKIPKKDFEHFKLIQNPECLGASNINEYIKIRKDMDLSISEKEIRLRWKVINPPYTITVANDIDPKYIVNKFKKGGSMKLIPKGQNAFANGILYLGDKLWDGTKWIAHKINEHGNSKSKGTTTASTLARADLKWALKRKHPNWNENLVEAEILRLEKQAYEKRPTVAETAAGTALAADAVGPFLGGYGKIIQGITSAIDKTYDWAAAIDEPKPSNAIHVATNYGEKIAKVIPGKTDDYVLKGLNLIGNADDAASANGSNLFGWADDLFKLHGKINNTNNKESVRESTNISIQKLFKKGGNIEYFSRGGITKKTMKELDLFPEMAEEAEKILKLKNSERAKKAAATRKRNFENLPEYEQEIILNDRALAKKLKLLAKDIESSLEAIASGKFIPEIKWNPEEWLLMRKRMDRYDPSLKPGESYGKPASPTNPKGYTIEDIEIFKAHIPELLAIEYRTKKNGTWMKNSDGSTYDHDPRIWLMWKLENIKHHNPMTLYSGMHSDYAAKFMNYKGRVFATENPGTYFGDTAIPFRTSTSGFELFDAGGRTYDQVLYENGRGVSTDSLLARTKGRGIIADNVNESWADVGDSYGEIANSADLFRDYAFNEGHPRWFLWGNTGNFNMGFNKHGGHLVQKHELGKILEKINPFEIFKKRAINKGIDPEAIDLIRKYNLRTESGRLKAAEYVVKLDGLKGEEAKQVIEDYKNAFKAAVDSDPRATGMAFGQDFPVVHSETLSNKYDTLLQDLHEYAHSLQSSCEEMIPEKAIHSEDLKLDSPDIDELNYFIKDNGNEVAVRISLLLSDAGITDASEITGNQLKKIWETYRDSRHLDNDMKFVFNKVRDWNALAKWASNPRNVLIVPAAIAGAGTIATTTLNTEAPMAKQGMKFQEGGNIVQELKPFYEQIAEIPIFRHLPNRIVAEEFDTDLQDLLNRKEISYGQLSEDAEIELLKKYNLSGKQLKETLDDLFNNGLGAALIMDIPEISENNENDLLFAKEGGTLIPKFANPFKPIFKGESKKVLNDILVMEPKYSTAFLILAEITGIPIETIILQAAERSYNKPIKEAIETIQGFRETSLGKKFLEIRSLERQNYLYHRAQTSEEKLKYKLTKEQSEKLKKTSSAELLDLLLKSEEGIKLYNRAKKDSRFAEFVRAHDASISFDSSFLQRLEDAKVSDLETLGIVGIASKETARISKGLLHTLKVSAKNTKNPKIQILYDVFNDAYQKNKPISDELVQYVSNILKVPTQNKNSEFMEFTRKSILKDGIDAKLDAKLDLALSALKAELNGKFGVTKEILRENLIKSGSVSLHFLDNALITGAQREYFGEKEWLEAYKRQVGDISAMTSAEAEAFKNGIIPERLKTAFHKNIQESHPLYLYFQHSNENIAQLRANHSYALYLVDSNPEFIPGTLVIMRRIKEPASTNKIYAVPRKNPITGKWETHVEKKTINVGNNPVGYGYFALDKNGNMVEISLDLRTVLEQHHAMPLSEMQSKVLYSDQGKHLLGKENITDKEYMEAYMNLLLDNPDLLEDFYNNFLLLTKPQHVGVNGIHHKDIIEILDLSRLKSLTRSGLFKTLEERNLFYSEVLKERLSYLMSGLSKELQQSLKEILKDYVKTSEKEIDSFTKETIEDILDSNLDIVTDSLYEHKHTNNPIYAISKFRLKLRLEQTERKKLALLEESRESKLQSLQNLSDRLAKTLKRLKLPTDPDKLKQMIIQQDPKVEEIKFSVAELLNEISSDNIKKYKLLENTEHTIPLDIVTVDGDSIEKVILAGMADANTGEIFTFNPILSKNGSKLNYRKYF